MGQLIHPDRGYNTCKKAAAVAVLTAWLEGKLNVLPQACSWCRSDMLMQGRGRATRCLICAPKKSKRPMEAPKLSPPIPASRGESHSQ